MNWTLRGMIIGIGLAMSLMHAAAVSAAQSTSCVGGPIRVGAVATITGVIDLHEVPEATRAVLADVNASGGIGGCPIDYIIVDDRGDPQVAAQVARDLVDNRQVHVLTGSASLVDCQANALFYERRGLLSLNGMGAEPACFKATNVLPVNIGPYALMTTMLSHAVDGLKHQRICAFFVNFGGTAGAAYRQAVTAWERDRGHKLHLIDASLPTQADHTPYVIRARDAGCQTVVSNLTESLAIQWVRTAERQRVDGISWLLLAPVFTENVEKAIGATTQKVLVFTEWEPATDRTRPPDETWRQLMAKNGLPLNQKTQAGFAAGTVLVKALRALKDTRTRATISAALRGVVMQNGAYQPASIPMRVTKIVSLVNGAWRVLPDEPPRQTRIAK